MPRTTILDKPAALRNAPPAPPDLSPEERALWATSISARPTAEWTPADCTLLRLYVCAALDVRRLDQQIAKYGEVVDGKINPLVRVRASREALVLATAKRLRLSPCSRYTAKDVGRLHRHASKARTAAATLDEDDLLAGHGGLQ